MNTYNLNSSFESGSSSSNSKQFKSIKDSFKNCKSQRKIPGWMQENERSSSDLMGFGENEKSISNKIEEADSEKYNENQIVPNSDFDTIINPSTKKDEINSNSSFIYHNNLLVNRVGISKNENSILNKVINPSMDNSKFQKNIEDLSKIGQTNYENSEAELNPYFPSQPTLSRESNFEYNKKHNISQNIFSKNQMNQNFGPKPYIQSKFSLIENR